LKIRRLSDSEFSASLVEPMTAVQMVLLLVMFAALLVFVLFWTLFWAGLPVERMMCVSIGVALTATGLNFIGEALRPNWGAGRRWNPPPDHRVVLPGRLTSLAFGIWFCAGGLVFLGYGWLTEHIVPGILGAFPAAFVLVIVGFWYDRRRAEAARAAVRRRGWHMASRRDDTDLPAGEAQRRQVAREEQGRSIQRHLTGRTTLERIETQHRYLVDSAGHAGPPIDWPEVAEEWLAFRSAHAEGDEIWEFNTVSVRIGLARREEGFALVRDGTVVDWFITAVVG